MKAFFASLLAILTRPPRKAPPEFKPDGIYNGVPYKFNRDGSIQAVRQGAVIHFLDFNHFVADTPGSWHIPTLLASTAAALCLSLVAVSHYYGYLAIVGFDWSHLSVALADVLIFGITAGALLSAAGFNFGFLAGFYFFCLVVGYVWIAAFSTRQYDHTWATVSVALSALTLLLPALYIDRPLPRAVILSEQFFERALVALTLLSALIVATGMLYNFRIVGLNDIYLYRPGIRIPTPMSYALGISFSTFLPFAFAGFIELRRRGWSVVCLAIMLAFYSVTTAKVALFGPCWLVFLFVLSCICEIRIALILSLLVPLVCGLTLVPLMAAGLLTSNPVTFLFGYVNFRMVAIPSIALDVYSDFFTHHPQTHFCQMSPLRYMIACPYEEPLGEVMEQAYHFGSFNASLFATEGVASVGPLLAPFVTFLCGLVFSVGNCTSNALPPRFVLLSSGIVLVDLVNVPLSTTILSHGMGLLFIFWYLAPRSSGQLSHP